MCRPYLSERLKNNDSVLVIFEIFDTSHNSQRLDHLITGINAFFQDLEDLRMLSETQKQQYADLTAKLNNTQVQCYPKIQGVLSAPGLHHDVWSDASQFHVQKTLEQTQDELHETHENLKQANFAIRERDFVIASQREAG